MCYAEYTVLIHDEPVFISLPTVADSCSAILHRYIAMQARRGSHVHLTLVFSYADAAQEATALASFSVFMSTTRARASVTRVVH